jgi:hypothetical protein
LGLADPVALALDVDDVGVVHDALDEGGGADRGGEDRVPLLEGEVRGDPPSMMQLQSHEVLRRPASVKVRVVAAA